MSYEMPFKSITCHKATATDLSQARYKFVDVDSNGDLKLAAAGKVPVGVLQEPGEANKGPMALPVVVEGIYPVIAGGTVAAGDEIEVGAGGTAIKANTGTIIGKCLEGGAIGEQIAVLLK